MKVGIGEPIIIKFYAPLNMSDTDSEIIYNFADYENYSNDHEYCLFQCFKMAYYVSKVYSFEILKMRCEFTKDEDGHIWFMYANDI